MLEIIKAVTNNAKVIIMDEPTSSITQREVENLFDKIEEELYVLKKIFFLIIKKYFKKF